MKPRLLDLFCGAGGCAKGYQRAGFYVVGVDINPQPRYCGDEFIQADVMGLDLEFIASFDAVHASPPCQAFSAFKHMNTPKPKLIDAMRIMLDASGLPFVIENVGGSPLPDSPRLFGNSGIQLCGTSFGLKVYRHRKFESNIPLQSLPCNHKDRAMNPFNQVGREAIYAVYGMGKEPEIYWKNEMGLDWMVKRSEWRESMPPVYTEFIGNQLMEYLKARSSA